MADGRQKAFSGPVIYHIGRDYRPISEIHRDGVPLTRPDAATVGTEDEALLVVLSDYCPEFLLLERKAVGAAGLEQLGNRCPAAGVEPEPDPFGAMPQDQAQELADLNTGVGYHYARNTSVRPRVKSCSVIVRTMARAILSPPWLDGSMGLA